MIAQHYSGELGRRVKELREQRKRTDPRFSVRQFAQALGVSPAFISQLEHGGKFVPKNAVIEKMAELLEVDTDELFALAHKVAPDIIDLIVAQPAWAMFLRTATARGWTAEEARRILDDHDRHTVEV